MEEAASDTLGLGRRILKEETKESIDDNFS